MKKLLILVLMGLMASYTTGCKKPAETKETFKWQVDQFADIRILRYQVPGFEELSPRQKELIYYLSEAALWGRGGSFSLDGVHPGHTVHTHIANIILQGINSALDLNAPLWDLASVVSSDPYVDFDDDGWVAGPDLAASGRTKILYLFKDYQEGVPGPAVIDLMAPADVWSLISSALLEEIIGIPLIRAEAERIGAIQLKK